MECNFTKNITLLASRNSNGPSSSLFIKKLGTADKFQKNKIKALPKTLAAKAESRRLTSLMLAFGNTLDSKFYNCSYVHTCNLISCFISEKDWIEL